ncbi:MAG: alpha-glucan family phosphorylase [Planctomycetota bacterium]|nr:alpha-glucan family phosphorylase [Planctomycetota bacterium]
MPHTLFEVSWEVCNKVGGIHTVLSTKAKTVVERYGDDYVCIGPWLLSSDHEPPFEDTPGFEDFVEVCREMGVPVRVGRWLVPGRPRTILVEFSGLYDQRDEILAGLWERNQVDSIHGDWGYVEPVLFGHACGMVIEKWFQERVSLFHGRAVAQFHEWMTASGMLYLKERVPEIGTVFTTHATMLGRAIASTGKPPQEGLEGRPPEEVADTIGVTAKHSMEGAGARAADAFTTVSDITADEAQAFHHRRAEPILANGIDLSVIDEIAGDVDRSAARAMLCDLAGKFMGEDLSNAAMFAISGRYEFHNKGIDVFLDALHTLDQRPGRPVVGWILVPAGNSGLRKDLADRMEAPAAAAEPLGLATHNLFDAESDPVQVHCAKLGLTNAHGSRVKVIQVPIYLDSGDGFLGVPYEAVLRAMDLSCFPSFYEPWGYTPEESLAVGVPTVTSDHAGFGRWCRANGLGPEHGVYVLSRENVDDEDAVHGLEDILETALAEGQDLDAMVRVCRETAQRTAWAGLVHNYYTAYDAALEAAQLRTQREKRQRRRSVEPAREPGSAERPRLGRFDVAATLPDELRGLTRLAENYWWSWDREACSLFEELSAQRWEACRHSPDRFLRETYPEDLAAKAQDADYVSRLNAVLQRFDDYMAEATRPDLAGSGGPVTRHRPATYFSAEFAIHESLRIYSGGLGVLAGDHLKSASDLNLPLVAVGLFYSRGYMRQRVLATGEQVVEEDGNDPEALPLEPVRGADGQRLRIELHLPSSRLLLQAWRVMVGRVPLYLLDSDLPDNRPEDRSITHTLYGGDHEDRLRQEIALGCGGAKLLDVLGIVPSCWHINEGHAAFLSLERVRALIRDDGLTFDEAREVCRATTCFTTHTPVPAGHDRFDEDLVRRYFSDVHEWLGVPWERFWALGQAQDDPGDFNMTYLALSFASVVNGVSEVHGQVSRELLHRYWPGLLAEEVPVTHITNGVHLRTWTGPDLAKALRADGPVELGDFAAAADLATNQLSQVRFDARARLRERMRKHLEQCSRERNDRPALVEEMLAGLDPDALYIGFARRFAPYKRAHLLFHDVERLAAILDGADRPVRVIVAGKAHPKDESGQEVMRRVAELTRGAPFLGKVFFVENYDVALAAHLVQGADVWLNTPTRALEASGTSGMKAAANGVLNVSIQDGWWAEAATDGNGWSIGGPRVFDDQALQDELDATTLYQLLEEEVVPLWFERDADGVAHGWIERVKRSLVTIPPRFNTDRMVADYRDRAYVPLAHNLTSLVAEDYGLARSLAERHHRIRHAFGDIRILDTEIGDVGAIPIGDNVEARARVDLGGVSQRDVVVELVLGQASSSGDLTNPVIVALPSTDANDGSVVNFSGSYRIERCGSFVHGLRVRAREGEPWDRGLCDLVLWA